MVQIQFVQWLTVTANGLKSYLPTLVDVQVLIIYFHTNNIYWGMTMDKPSRLARGLVMVYHHQENII